MTPNANAPLLRGEREEYFMARITHANGDVWRSEVMHEKTACQIVNEFVVEWEQGKCDLVSAHLVKFVELRDGESITTPASSDDERAEWWMIRMDDGRLFALTGDKGTAERWAPDRSTPVRFVELRDGETIQAARASGTKAETREGM